MRPSGTAPEEGPLTKRKPHDPEVETVLREVVMSARALTGARCGVIAAVDEAGRARRPMSPRASRLKKSARWRLGLRIPVETDH